MSAVETVIVGAGQAGLALSRYLTDSGHEHLLLERGDVAQRWRTERWDSFRLLTPNWQTRLPGYSYRGGNPAGFMGRDAVIGFFADYARSFNPPVLTGADVTSVLSNEKGWQVQSSAGRLDAWNVVIATGHYATPRVPQLAACLPAGITQMFARDYRNPGQLPAGAVLVVGAGPSGQQIADELARAGRRVFLAVGRHRPLPRRYRGGDVYWWLERIGALHRTVDTLPDPRAAAAAPSAVLAGEDDDLHLRRLVGHGVTAVGHLVSLEGTLLGFSADLADSLAGADAHVAEFRAKVDHHIASTRLEAPGEWHEQPDVPCWAVHPAVQLDVRARGITTVIWAAGYRRDYSWVHAPVLDDTGEPVQRRGITAAAGLMFLGLRFMYRRNSNFIDGVGADAEHLAGRIAARSQQRAAA